MRISIYVHIDICIYFTFTNGDIPGFTAGICAYQYMSILIYAYFNIYAYQYMHICIYLKPEVLKKAVASMFTRLYNSI